MEIVPGKKLGMYEIGQNLYDAIKTLDCDFKYEIRESNSLLSTKTFYFVFDEKKELDTVTTRSNTKANFNGIGYNTKISQIIEIFPNATFSIDGDISIPDHPGICFLFSNSDTELLYESGCHNEGLNDFVGDIKVKHIVLSKT